MLSNLSEFVDDLLDLAARSDPEETRRVLRHRVETSVSVRHPGWPVPAEQLERLVRAMDAFARSAIEEGHAAAYRTGGDALVEAFRLVFGGDLRLLLIVRDLPARRVLILGETGVGKERMARTIAVAFAALSAGPAPVSLSAAAFPESLLESELFGHRKGAFTGASADRAGVLRSLGPGATLFLDEIGKTSLAFQTRLLRVLESGEVRPVGADAAAPERVRFHLVAATSLGPAELADSTCFRQDLYHRLTGNRLRLPPLRELLAGDRHEARRILEALVDREQQQMEKHLLPEYRVLLGMTLGEPAPIARELARRTTGYGWPGNLRELGNLVRRILLEGTERLPVLCEELVGPASGPPPGEAAPMDLKSRLEQVERAAYAQAAAASDTVRAVALRLGVTRQTAARRLSHFELEPGSKDQTPRTKTWSS